MWVEFLYPRQTGYRKQWLCAVNVMHGGWFLYQVSMFMYLEPGQWHGFFSFLSFLSAFTFLLQLLSFWLQVPWYGCTTYGDLVYFKRLSAGRYCLWKMLTKSSPFYYFSFFEMPHHFWLDCLRPNINDHEYRYRRKHSYSGMAVARAK